MGLDMYLRSETRVPPDSKNRDAILKLLGAAEYADAGTGFWVEIPIGYWRKANAVHGWFVKKLARGRDSCKPINVTRGNLEALRDLCNEVLKNPAKAAELLPPQDASSRTEKAEEVALLASGEDSVWQSSKPKRKGRKS
jgi:hypothetical protein